MTALTTIKVSTATGDELTALADKEGLSLDGALKKSFRLERQRQMALISPSEG